MFDNDYGSNQALIVFENDRPGGFDELIHELFGFPSFPKLFENDSYFPNDNSRVEYLLRLHKIVQVF